METNQIEKQYIKEYEKKVGIDIIIQKEKDLKCDTRGVKGKRWMALSARLLNDDTKIRLKTKHEIGYWVNYGDDETYGMFSIEQIEQWLTTPDLLLYKLGGTRECIIHHGR